MNNGKVRIYELSRELNLENKDILAVCDRLNIPVKSHSSTITEMEAERIEKFVESYPDKVSAAAKSKTKPSSSEDNNSNNKKKQEILEIRKQKTRSNTKPQGAQTQASAPQPAQSSSHQPNQNQPMILNRPARPNEGDASASEENRGTPAESMAESTETNLQHPTTSDQDAESTETSATESSPEQPDPNEDQEVKLQSPPVRPMPPSEQKSETTTKVERPVLKQPPKKESAGSRSSGKTPTPASGGSRAEKSTETTRPTPPTPVQAKKEGDSRRQQPAAAKPQLSKPDVQRPRSGAAGKDTQAPAAKSKGERPSAIAPDIEPQDTADEAVEEFADTPKTPKLKAPPRPPKRLKKRKEEEEDLQEFPEKPSKSSSKGKRRPKPIVDEDEDDFETQLDRDRNEEISAVSLSTARPAKPKSTPTQRPSGSTPPPTKTKKPDSSREATSKQRGRRGDKPDKKERPDTLVLREPLTVRELASSLNVAETEIVKILFFKGIPVNITQTLDLPTATMVAEELEVSVETAEVESEAKKVSEMLDAADLENLQLRPPVVTIMGHVDHGKTTLLDSIRKTKVAQGEAGGITQHIGAYHVDVEHEGQMHQVVFLDTPGHEAFTAMRARGTRVTDIAILVVAADDGVQPQTIEAISHAKAAQVPIVVAINKVDKEGSDANRVKQELMEQGLVPEEWGGDTIMVPVSAIKGENLDALLEMIILVAELEEISANPDRAAKGTVIEAHLDKSRGPVATLLVQNGTLNVGDVLVAGSTMGKVRAMIDDRGARVEQASPSFAVEILGLSDVPAAGDEFEVYPSEKEARSISDERAEESRQTRLQQAMASRRVTLNTLSARAQEGELKELNLVLKADVQGSVEAILGSLKQLPQNEVQVRVLLAAPGEVTETDVDLAAASDAVIVAFNSTFASGARHAADLAGVDVREYNIIYKLLDDIQAAMEGLLDPELVEEPLGEAQVRAVFQVGRGAVAGCYVQTGKVVRNSKVRVHRNGSVVYEGVLDSLKRVKDDVKEVNTGFECGIGIDKFNDWNEGDTIEAYRMVTKRRTLSPA
ncbi:translation initiation factor IF-2 [Phormidium sp. CCY1219]|uniref:translation initiation factor IF-2 n=1 Tax=Phormidium sp. CCY1219 TaxID=2886104 RepID=UPI002D1F20BD|nr:translation initiation factor IF-2 [Phormidium sp. CCY1219]MEB3826770.1 translation initiation factor IF-2 [Phormidium sp. CCY1219]